MDWRDKRVLVTGLTGFAGGYLAKFLVDQGATVYGLARRRSDKSDPKNLRYHGIVESVQIVEGDLLDLTSLAFALDQSEPDVIFHLGAQSYVPASFNHPLDTMQTNVMGTLNLLETVRIKRRSPVIVFAGSSEEYGLVFASERQYAEARKSYESVFPEPERFPELPIDESNPLRPMSPYAASKVAGDFAMRNYYHSYGLRTIVSRAFNHEGAGRGAAFVTSVVMRQVVDVMLGKADKVVIGNVNAFRDWSHVGDVVSGYSLLAEKGVPGEVYVQGSQRTNSVLTYLLLGLEQAGFTIEKISTMRGEKTVRDPLTVDHSGMWGVPFAKYRVDSAILEDGMSFELEDEGVWIDSNKGRLPVYFDPARFRPAEVPILLANTTKLAALGFSVEHSLGDLVRDQLNYYLGNET